VQVGLGWMSFLSLTQQCEETEGNLEVLPQLGKDHPVVSSFFALTPGGKKVAAFVLTHQNVYPNCTYSHMH